MSEKRVKFFKVLSSDDIKISDVARQTLDYLGNILCTLIDLAEAGKDYADLFNRQVGIALKVLLEVMDNDEIT